MEFGRAPRLMRPGQCSAISDHFYLLHMQSRIHLTAADLLGAGCWLLGRSIIQSVSQSVSHQVIKSMKCVSSLVAQPSVAQARNAEWCVSGGSGEFWQ